MPKYSLVAVLFISLFSITQVTRADDREDDKWLHQEVPYVEVDYAPVHDAAGAVVDFTTKRIPYALGEQLPRFAERTVYPALRSGAHGMRNTFEAGGNLLKDGVKAGASMTYNFATDDAPKAINSFYTNVKNSIPKENNISDNLAAIEAERQNRGN